MSCPESLIHSRQITNIPRAGGREQLKGGGRGYVKSQGETHYVTDAMKSMASQQPVLLILGMSVPRVFLFKC